MEIKHSELLNYAALINLQMNEMDRDTQRKKSNRKLSSLGQP